MRKLKKRKYSYCGWIATHSRFPATPTVSHDDFLVPYRIIHHLSSLDIKVRAVEQVELVQRISVGFYPFLGMEIENLGGGLSEISVSFEATIGDCC